MSFFLGIRLVKNRNYGYRGQSNSSRKRSTAIKNQPLKTTPHNHNQNHTLLKMRKFPKLSKPKRKLSEHNNNRLKRLAQLQT